MGPSDRDEACFEAGVKLGALYHQFIGTPVAPDTAAGLASAMADAAERQPGCRDARVDLDAERIETDLNRFGYTGLTGDHIRAVVTVEMGDTVVEASIAMDDDYPLMRIDRIEES